MRTVSCGCCTEGCICAFHQQNPHPHTTSPLDSGEQEYSGFRFGRYIPRNSGGPTLRPDPTGEGRTDGMSYLDKDNL